MARRLLRSADDRLVAGVASGLAEHLRLDPLAVRLGFVALAGLGGIGVVLYAAFWLSVPLAEASPARRRAPRGQLLALTSLAAGGFLLLHAAGLGIGGVELWPVALAAVGAALVWRQADEGRRARWRAVAHGPPVGLVRLFAGVALVVAGAAGFLAVRGDLGALRQSLAATVVTVVGLALLTGPWWARTLRDLGEERRARIREQERAELAAHLHDSVLQTLALIQRRAGDPAQVATLARRQERELRAWLYGAPAPDASFRAALDSLVGDVEDGHGVPVEAVVVGDRPLGPGLEALLQATREAVVNAARWSGAPQVSLYAEVDAASATVFVRDRGKGFDPDAVPDGRMGLRESVIGRMARHGGSASVKSAPGEGTEVRLEVRA